MKRKGLEDLKKWVTHQKRKPLVLRGARQVGKSTLVRLFAQEEHLDLCEINLEKYSNLQKVFETLDLKKILDELQAVAQKKIGPNTLLFLDEIQAVPAAFLSLRYFYEERPDLPVIAAGSLLDFLLEEGPYSVPVGRVEYLYMGPMDFEEFLEAKGEIDLLEVIQSITHSVTETHHYRLLDELKKYFFVGGMPSAVIAHVAGQPYHEIQMLQETLLDTFREDFNKYSKRQDIPLLREVFGKIPANVGKKIKYVNLARDEKSRDVKKVLDLLVRARLVQPVYHSDCSGIPINALASPSVFKLIYLDIGLYFATTGLRWKDYSAMDNSDLLISGTLAEQFVGQTLLCGRTHTEPELYYWLREEKAHLAEVDYVVQLGREILPIEVKAGAAGTQKSLHQFVFAKKTSRAVRLSMSPPRLSIVQHRVKTKNGSMPITYQEVALPLYLAGQLERVLQGVSPVSETGTS